ncbi:hypothetical protein [Legionella pneumophila]
MEYIKKLWKGDISLGITFWVFGVVVLGCFRILFYFINQNYISIIVKYGNYPIYILSAIALLYSFFIWIAIWSSSIKYNGSKFIAAVAKVIVIISVANTLVAYNNLLFEHENVDTNNLEQVVHTLNKGLPTKIDEHVELYKISLNNKTIIYYARFVNLNSEQTNYLKNLNNNVENLIANNLNKSICNDKELKGFLKQNGDFYYHLEIDGTELFKIHITKNNCF